MLEERPMPEITKALSSTLYIDEDFAVSGQGKLVPSEKHTEHDLIHFYRIN